MWVVVCGSGNSGFGWIVGDEGSGVCLLCCCVGGWEV